MEVKTRLVTRPNSNEASLFLPKEKWMRLTTELKGNTMTVVLRIEGIG